MKYLKKLILERKNLGDLYHVLDYDKLLYVLKNNKITSYKAGDGNISLTRNKMLNSYLGDSPQSMFKLIIDGDKLSDKYRIKPFRFFSRNGQGFEEYEERVSAREITNVFSYIKGVVIIKKRVERLMRYPWHKESEVSDYLTTVGARNGTLPEMIKKITEEVDYRGLELYVQEDNKISKNDEFINYIINYPIKVVKQKNIILYRGYISDEGRFGAKDILVDIEGKIVSDSMVIGHVLDYPLEEIETDEVNKDNVKSLKDKYDDRIFDISSKKLEPYVVMLRLLDNGKWKIDDMRKLDWY